MSYCLADVDRYEQRLREALPDAIIERRDFGFGLGVTRPGLKYALTIFSPAWSTPQVPVETAINLLMDEGS